MSSPTKKPIKKTVKKAVKPVAKKPIKRTPVAPYNKVTVVLGPYGTQAEADREVLEFKHPNVFMYRSAIFIIGWVDDQLVIGTNP